MSIECPFVHGSWTTSENSRGDNVYHEMAEKIQAVDGRLSRNAMQNLEEESSSS